MMKRNIELEESFFEDYEPKDADRIKFFLKEVDSELRNRILEIEKTSDTEPILMGLVISKEISSIFEKIERPDFGDLGMSEAELEELMEYVAQEVLSDYFRQFEQDDEQILKAMWIINKI